MAPVALAHDLTGPPGAPVLVLGNSLGTRGELWEPQLPAFARRFRVLRYDHRGHGASPAPPGPYTMDDLGGDVLALLDALGLATVSYAGVSIGGMVGMWLAVHAPDRVERLAVCCSTARFPSADPWLERAAAVRARGVAPIADQVVSRWFTPAFFASAPAVVRRFRDTLAGTDAEAYASCCDALSRLDLRPALPSIAASTIVLAGAADQATPPAEGAAIADAVADGRLHVVPGAAHLANVEQPAAVTDLLLAHFAGGR